MGSAGTFRRPSLAALSYRETLQPVPRFGATDRTPADPLYFGHFNQSAKEIAPPGLRWALLLRSRVADAHVGVRVHVLPATRSRIQLIVVQSLLPSVAGVRFPHGDAESRHIAEYFLLKQIYIKRDSRAPSSPYAYSAPSTTKRVRARHSSHDVSSQASHEEAVAKAGR